MRTYLDILALKFLTGRDGLPAFWKLVHIGGMVFAFMLAVMCYRQRTLVAGLGWLVSLAILLQFSAHSLAGLRLWKDAGAAPKLVENHTTNVDVAAVIHELRRPVTEPDMYRDDERGDA